MDLTAKPAEPLEVELLATADERRPMGTERLEFETERLRTATEAARPLPAGRDEELEQFIEELRRVKPERRRK